MSVIPKFNYNNFINDVKNVTRLETTKKQEDIILKVNIHYLNNKKLTDIPLFEYFLNDDFEENNKGFEKLLELSMIYKFSMMSYLLSEIALSMVLLDTLFKDNIIKNNINLISHNELNELIEFNFMNHITSERTQIYDFINIPSDIKELLLDTTFKVAQDNIKQQEIKIKNCRYISIQDDLTSHLENIKAKMLNKRVLAKLEKSYLAKIALDSFSFSEKYNSFYLKEYSEGISQGYSERSFLLGVDKEKAIRELNLKITILQDYKNKESLLLIEKTQKLIELAKQKKHKDKIPFKTIAKRLKMSANEAKNFTKHLMSANDFSSFNENSYKTYYET